MSDSHELKTLRLMAIERAIGEVKAALMTFWKDTNGYESQYENLKNALEMLKECR